MPSFPRSKASELQEARNHLEYWRWKSEALASAGARIEADLKLCQKEEKAYTAKVEKLEGKKE